MNIPNTLLEQVKQIKNTRVVEPVNPLNLTSFYQAARSRGFSKNYQARVTDIRLNGKFANEKIFSYIKSFTLPKPKVQINTHNYLGYVVREPGNVLTSADNGVNITFFSDSFLAIRQFFELGVYEQAGTGNADLGALAATSGLKGQNNYIEITIYNDLRPVRVYTLISIIIAEIGETTYDVSGDGKIQEFTVTFGYQTFSSESVEGFVVDVDNMDSISSFAFDRAGPTQENSLKTVPNISPEPQPQPPQRNFLEKTLETLKGVSQVIRAGSGAINAVGGVANAIRGTGRAIRGR